MRLHTTLGYQIISQSRQFNYVKAHAALQHHERLDGSGYPRGLRGDKIFEIGRIVAVADVFCAVTSKRVYRCKVLPREAVGLLRDAVGYLRAATENFDQRLVRRLALRVAAFPNGTFLRLSTGELVVMVRQDPRNTERPVVRLRADPGNRPVEQVWVALAEAPELGVAFALDGIPEVRRAPKRENDAGTRLRRGGCRCHRHLPGHYGPEPDGPTPINGGALGFPTERPPLPVAVAPLPFRWRTVRGPMPGCRVRLPGHAYLGYLRRRSSPT